MIVMRRQEMAERLEKLEAEVADLRKQVAALAKPRPTGSKPKTD